MSSSQAKPLRVVFMGTPDFAVASMQAILSSQHEVVGVVTAPDRPAGRGHKLQSSAVKQAAVEANIPVLQPLKLKDEQFLNALKALEADVFVVVAFRMLPKAVWDMPSLGTFNLHASLLPQYRGAAPINWAIINGEKESGVSTFLLDEKIDTGALLFQERISIPSGYTAGQLHDDLMELGAPLVVRTLNALSDGTAKAIDQEKISVSQPLKEAPKLHKSNTRIDWNLAASNIIQQIKGLSPYPGAWTTWPNRDMQPVKIWDAQESNAQLPPGAMTWKDGSLLVGTNTKAIEVLSIQIPGKRKMNPKDLMNGIKALEENDALD